MMLLEVNFMPYVWLFASLGFLLLELLTPGLFFFIAFSCGFACSAIVAFLGFSVLVQLWIALISGTLCFIAIKVFFASHKIKKIESKTNVDALIGLDCVVVEPIGVHNPGIVKVKSELWGAIIKEGSELQKGTSVRVVDVQGNKLVVRSL
jgi:membrane protein implicated in regulation of membrane protease activity